MRTLVLALIGFAPFAAYAQINCQKWADGNQTCYYADGRIMDGRRQIDGSVRWTENRPQPAAPGSIAGSAPGSPGTSDTPNQQTDSPRSMQGTISNDAIPHYDGIRHPWDRHRPGIMGNPMNVPDTATGDCGQYGSRSSDCDGAYRR